MKYLVSAALIVLGNAAYAGPTENITGCATRPVEGSNATQLVVPGCLGGSASGAAPTARVDVIADYISDQREKPVEK